MINRTTLVAVVLCFLSLTSAIYAQPAASKTDETYKDSLAKLKNGDTKIDFKALRIAYTRTDEYSPYGISADIKNQLYDALAAKKYTEVIRIAEKELENNYVEMNSHFVAFVAHKELGNKDKSELHKTMFAALLASIIDGKDGKTPETAFEVISVPEEYVLLNFLGLRRTKQVLIDKDGSKFDKLSVTDPETNESFDLYFNVDIVFVGYGKMFGTTK